MSESTLLLHPADQPVFRLLVDVRGCRCEVRINDAPVWSNTDGLAARAMLSVNEWLYCGENPVELRLAAPPGADAAAGTSAVLPDSAAVQCTLLYKRNRAPWLSMQELHPCSYRHRDDFRNVGIFAAASPNNPQIANPEDEAAPATPASEEPSPQPWIVQPGQQAALPAAPLVSDWLPGGVGIRCGFTVNLPSVWPACPWNRAIDLTAMPGLDYTVSRLIRSICDSLQRRDWIGLKRFFADRRAALQTACYLSEADCDEAMAYPRLLQAHDTKIQTVDPQAVKGHVCGGGRLLRAVTGEPAKPAVVLTCPSMSCQAEMETFWLNTGNEWRLAH